jgi:hypothetical protein
MQTGSIIDFYDDPNGMVLSEKIAEAQIPAFIKEATFLSPEDRQALPDDVFALVMVDQGEKIRKYACVDKGNTALNVMYFLENRDRLPLEAQKTAAARLQQACRDHQLDAPMILQKLAGAVDHPYVDVTGQQPPPRFSKRASERHALGDRFPIDSCGQIKEAAAWFNDYGTSLHPAERRTFCQNLEARADELGMPIDNDDIRKYAGSGYAPDGELKVAVCTRMQYWTEDSPERDLLKGLMNKYAHVPPEVFCESLRQFDEQTGMNHHWDEGVCDPWYTTYGIEKSAEWSWEDGNDRLTEDVLKKGVCAHLDSLKKKFGEDLVLELQKKPVQIFDSLPLDHKRIISRVVNDAL